MSKRLQVQIWSDIACPWCFVGKRRFEGALRQFAHADEVEVVWRAFELDPRAPKTTPTRHYTERLAAKYGTTRTQAQQMIDRMVETAGRDGLHMDFERIQPGNTFDAHRLLHLALDHGLQDTLKERLLRAYLEEGRSISDHDTLRALAIEVGLAEDLVSGVLATDQYAREVRADEEQAHALGIHGVPFFVLANRYAVEGAQPAELLLSALERAWSELPQPPEIIGGDGEVCGPEGCEVPEATRA
ncbi:MAG TPA: DsbA family oxidoreductase [Polyangiales bacterium]|nr:DsbA family oxidoreductase [Polyangiales bacterium]